MFEILEERSSVIIFTKLNIKVSTLRGTVIEVNELEEAQLPKKYFLAFLTLPKGHFDFFPLYCAMIASSFLKKNGFSESIN